ncbi:FAD dependent oxidoreductase [Rhodotorula toruloides]|uniref:FAD dependent oxidoreductase n=1 Tax=Rhodotorula toruloides TaxID=5286 RepID=A0A511KNV3_RHOTO|nr:FAD dependent oxidoreductase [Rhodotorula toruloides]
MPADPEHVVIIGSGIVGLCTAYYTLSLSSTARVLLLESSPSRSVAGGASSYAGGFIACGLSWHEPPSQALARLSWDCHRQLSDALRGESKWGYRECGAVGLAVGGTDESRSKYRTLPGGKGKEVVKAVKERLPPGQWIAGEREELDTVGGVAQVDPADFCKTVHDYLSSAFPHRFTTLFGEVLALSAPASIVARAASAVLSSTIAPSAKRTLTFTPHDPTATPVELPFDRLLIAAGPWSATVCEKLSLPPIPLTNLPGHSLLIRPALNLFTPSNSSTTPDLPSEAVFAGISGAVGGVHASTSGLARGLTDEEKREGYTRSPELFVRANGLIYVAGENSIPERGGPQRKNGLPNKLPDTVDGVKELLDERCIGRLKRAAGAVSPLLKEENGAVVEKEQFCYRPIAADREPIIGALAPDVFISTAMGPWGITLAPGAGKVVAEMMLGRETSADVMMLAPGRFAQAKL